MRFGSGCQEYQHRVNESAENRMNYSRKLHLLVHDLPPQLHDCPREVRVVGRLLQEEVLARDAGEVRHPRVGS